MKSLFNKLFNSGSYASGLAAAVEAYKMGAITARISPGTGDEYEDQPELREMFLKGVNETVNIRQLRAAQEVIAAKTAELAAATAAFETVKNELERLQGQLVATAASETAVEHQPEPDELEHLSIRLMSNGAIKLDETDSDDVDPALAGTLKLGMLSIAENIIKARLMDA